ncbi:MAG: phenylacetate-CoA oxygenase subunit PaaJ [Acidobacteriaceae bacterium]|nr:phenylacetate-CoA oxygenase subunit PaaJ [Acidobacteriaceae bacterium]
MVAARPSTAEVWKWLEQIADPEIPVLSIVDLGIVRDVQWQDAELMVTITPTYSGCPAMDAIQSDIRSSMKEHGVERLRLETKLSPAWTTDWITDDAKQRLRTYGIAPPARGLISLTPDIITCPYCGSNSTQIVSRFGSTPCKGLYKCRSCLEPFDAFKRH